MASFGAKTTAEEVVGNTDLTGKAAVVTGGNSGIGEETARVLANAGAKVILTSRSAANAESVAKALKEAGVKAHPSLPPSVPSSLLSSTRYPLSGWAVPARVTVEVTQGLTDL
jgi:NAD(P)-dependent dehydrogenase (short-subunit alcohol dehydrogenase family)